MVGPYVAVLLGDGACWSHAGGGVVCWLICVQHGWASGYGGWVDMGWVIKKLCF
jgi:hypothetical protein